MQFITAQRQHKTTIRSRWSDSIYSISNVTTIVVLALSFFLQAELRAQTLKVYIFAGQSNCKGAGGKVCQASNGDCGGNRAFYDHNNGALLEKDRKTLYYYKTISDVKETFDPGMEANWHTNTNLNPNQFWLRHEFGQFNETYEGTIAHIFKSGNTFNARVGAEVQFARRMQDQLAQTNNENVHIAIVKVAAGSSSILQWEPAGNLSPAERVRVSKDGGDFNRYLLFEDHLLSTLSRAKVTFQNEYEDVEFAGLVWIQGERDLASLSIPGSQREWEYKNSFVRMVTVLRNRFNKTMPFVIMLTDGFKNKGDFLGVGGLNESLYSERVRKLRRAQKSLGAKSSVLQGGTWVKSNANMRLQYRVPIPDPVHWDSESLQRMGNLFFNKLKHTLDQ